MGKQPGRCVRVLLVRDGEQCQPPADGARQVGVRVAQQIIGRGAQRCVDIGAENPVGEVRDRYAVPQQAPGLHGA